MSDNTSREVVYEIQKPVRLDTDSDFENLFIKIAEEIKPDSFSDFELYIKTAFKENEKVMTKLAAWSRKLALDRNKLKEVFKK